MWSAGSLQGGIQDLTSRPTPGLGGATSFYTPTCTHCHGRPGDHPHGGDAVVAGGGDGDGCWVEGRGGDAVGLHHRGVVDHMGLSRVDGLGVVSSLETSTHNQLSPVQDVQLWSLLPPSPVGEPDCCPAVLPVRRCSVGGRHCGWGTWGSGRGSGWGCTEEALRLTVSGELCTEFPLKCILKKQRKKKRG